MAKKWFLQTVINQEAGLGTAGINKLSTWTLMNSDLLAIAYTLINYIRMF